MTYQLTVCSPMITAVQDLNNKELNESQAKFSSDLDLCFFVSFVFLS